MKKLVVLLIVLCAALRAALAADEVTTLKAEVAVLRATVKNLQAKKAVLEAEKKELQTELDRIREVARAAGINLWAQEVGKPIPRSATFRALFKKYKHRYALLDGKFVRLPDFDLRYQNSHAGSRVPPKRNDVIFTGRREILLSGTFNGLRETWPTHFPDMKVGQFGRVSHCNIAGVLGADDIMINRLSRGGYPFGASGSIIMRRLVRVRGIKTENLIDGQAWRGPDETGLDIGIIGTCTIQVSHAPRTVLQALSMDVIRKGLSEDQFADLLAAGIDPEADDKADQGSKN